MAYQVSVYTADGERIATLPTAHTIAAARQSMLDHSNTVNLPAEEPLFLPSIGVLEGWFIGRTEYLIQQA